MCIRVLLAILLPILFLVHGCRKCGHVEEPELKVFIYDTTGLPTDTVFPRVYGAGGNGDLYPNAETAGGPVHYFLPLSVRDTSVTFYFESDTVKHVLEISYKSASSFESTWCGYTVRIENERVSYTTFPIAYIRSQYVTMYGSHGDPEVHIYL